MFVIKKVQVMSVGKITAFVGVLLGFLTGTIFTGMVLLGIDISPNATSSNSMVYALAFIILPIMYSLFGFIFGCIVAGTYNLAASWVGGVKISMDDKPRAPMSV